MTSKRKTFDMGRNAESGRFVPVATAKLHPKDHIVERVPKAGFGDTKD